MIPVQDVWPAVHGTPAKQVMDCRLSLAFEEFQTWAKESKIESAAEIQPGSSVVDLTEIARHSQPDFNAKGLRDLKSGVAELAAKGHNVPGLVR